jgi:chondroitin-sulfate-ABC endolyase/exolyase
MGNSTTMVVSAAVVLAACTTILGQEVGYFESFEDGVPDHFVASRPDSLSLSPWHYKHGENSLRWDWQAAEELVIRRGIGDPARRGEFGTRASFSVWLYMEEPVQGELVFEFREGETVTGSFRFPLQFTGWRQGRPFYHAFPTGQPTSEVDNIRIVAPTDTPQGTVFLDFIKYNTLTYGRNSVLPEITMQWRPPEPDEERYPRPDHVTDEELAGIRSLLGPDEGAGIEQARVDELCDRVDALGIVRDEHGVRGPGIDAHLQFHPSAHEATALGMKPSYWSDEHGLGWEGVEAPGAMSQLARQVAVAYRANNDDRQRERLAESYLLISDHLHDQVLQAGSGFQWNWWYGGNWAESVFLMRDLLADEGRLQGHTDYLLYTYGTGAIFAEGNPPSNMDFYNLTVPRMLQHCLLQVEPVEQVRWLRAFRDMLERSILQPNSAFKIDGSAYHHSAHYPSYATGAFQSLSALLLAFKDTPWRFSTEMHERVRRAAIAQRIYANFLDVPSSLHGRSTLKYSRRINAGALAPLALAGTPDGREEIDIEVAAAYLRVVPGAADEEPYRDLNITLEPNPQGVFVMPYAGLLSHRRDDWLVSLRGQSKYVWASERQDHHNRFGAFQSLGQLEVLASGSPVTAEASGRQQAGWDWARFEGTTVPHLPQSRLAEAWSGSVTYSPETFMGGLSHRGSQGAFGMTLNPPIRPDTTLTGRKSWFFVDNQIICLGSDIFCDEAEYPTQTTLCQKGLAPNDEGDHAPIVVDGEQVTAFSDEKQLDPARPHWFIDPYQVGYCLPAGQMTTVVRRHQTSRSSWDEEDTEGDMLTVWVDHGVAPTDGDYEYMLVVRATPDTMQSLSARPPYQVIQRDQNAHIIRHAATGLWGCVLFDEQELAAHTSDGDTLPVSSVDRACLVMAETADDGQLHLSVADPDLNLVDGVNEAQAMQVTLRGQWRLLDAKGTVCAWELEGVAGKVKVISTDADETVLEILCEHGASYDLTLARE